MFHNTTQSKSQPPEKSLQPLEIMNDESDSSDDSGPPTPKKSTYDRMVSTAKGHSNKSPARPRPVSPVTSPPRNLLSNTNSTVSPKRNLFGRPSKVSLHPLTVAPPHRDKDKEKEVISPLSPTYFNSHEVQQSQVASTTSSSSSSFSQLLRGNTGLPHTAHQPHQHIYSNSSAAKLSSSTSTRGKSLDVLRVPDRDGSLAYQPISPAFFNAASRNHSSSALDSDDIWPLICSRILPLFRGDGLRQPIEDLNRLVSNHLVRIVDHREESHVLEDLTELFETGIRSLDNSLASLTDEKLIVRLTELWVFFFSDVLPYLEAAFLPISIAWGVDASLYLPSSKESQSPSQYLSIHTLSLKCYRDILILPHQVRLRKILSDLPMLLNITSTSSSASSSTSDDSLDGVANGIRSNDNDDDAGSSSGSSSDGTFTSPNLFPSHSRPLTAPEALGDAENRVQSNLYRSDNHRDHRRRRHKHRDEGGNDSSSSSSNGNKPITRTDTSAGGRPRALEKHDSRGDTGRRRERGEGVGIGIGGVGDGAGAGVEGGAKDDTTRQPQQPQGELYSRILQCISLLRRVQSSDERQRECDALGDVFLFRRAKGRGDRRGFVPAKTATL